MKRIPLAYSLRNLWARRLTTALTAGGMALVVFVFAAVLMLDQGLKEALVDTGQADNVVVIRKGSETEVQSAVERSQAALIESLPQIARGVGGAPLVSKETVVLITLAKRDGDKPANVKLYLHMATEDSGWNVLLLAKRYGIFDRLIMTRADNQRPAFDDATMNLLYNACDVGLTTSTGEGWGMVAFEHGATRAAQVMPRHTSLAELWDGAAEFIEPVCSMTWPGNLTEGQVVSAEGVAAALQRLYEDSAHRDSLAHRAYANAHRPEFAWDVVAAQWRRLLDDTISR